MEARTRLTGWVLTLGMWLLSGCAGVATEVDVKSQSAGAAGSRAGTGTSVGQAGADWPAGLLPVVAERLAREAPSTWAPVAQAQGRVRLANPRHGFRASFDAEGMVLTTGEGVGVAMSFSGLGRGRAFDRVRNVRPAIDGARVVYRHETLSHWFINSPLGLEQGFTLGQRPPGAGELRLALTLGGGLSARVDDTGLVFVNPAGGVALRYGALAAFDARGRELPARLALEGQRLILGVNDTEAAYPVTVDPLFSKETKLVAGDAAELDNFGRAVAVDGDTAVIGAPYNDHAGTNSGSAYVFVRAGTTWSQQVKLVASDAAAYNYFGSAVALDGDTAVIGAYGNDDAGAYSGSAYVFVRTGSTWSQQAKLVASDATADDYFGSAVAVSGDTAVIGVVLDDHAGRASGSAYVFLRAGTNWSEQAKLVASDAAAGDWFGSGVAVDGATAVIGAYCDDDAGTDSGSAYVFDSPVDLGLVKQDDADPVEPGTVFSYSLIVTNYDTEADALGVTLTDPLPIGVSYVSATAGCAAAGGTVTCDLGTVPKQGGFAQAGITVRAGQAGQLSNTAQVTASQPDSNTGNNSDTETTVVNTAPVAHAQSVTTTKNAAVAITLSGSDADSDDLIYDRTATPAHGILGGHEPNLTYTPHPGYTGSDSFRFTVSDAFTTSAEATVTVTVNSRAPGAPVLDSPADGATAIDPASVTLRWHPSSDPDGDAIDYQLYYCEDAAFTGCAPVQVSAAAHDTPPDRFLAAMGSGAGILLLGFVSLGGPRRRTLNLIAVVLMALLISSCGSAGSDARSPVPVPVPVPDHTMRYTVTGLAAGTTYYWKVVADDTKGGTAESEVWQFSTE